MKTTCIATVAILGCASAAPRRIRNSQRSLQEGSMSMSMPGAGADEPSLFDTGATEAAVTIPAVIGESTVAAVPLPEEIMSMPDETVSDMISMSMSLPEDTSEEVVVEEVLWESLSIPAIYQEIYGSMSIPEGWTPEAEGYIATESGGYVEPGTVSPESDDTPSSDDAGSATEGESDDVPTGDREVSSATGVLISGVASAACLVSAIALF